MAVGVRRPFGFWGILRANENLFILGTGELVTLLVNSARTLFERIMGCQDKSNRGDDRFRRNEHQERSERSVIQPQFCRNGEGCAATYRRADGSKIFSSM